MDPFVTTSTSSTYTIVTFIVIVIVVEQGANDCLVFVGHGWAATAALSSTPPCRTHRRRLWPSKRAKGWDI